MKLQEKKELLRLLKQFFAESDLADRNIFARNEVAKLIKDELTKERRWKNLPRGDSKAYKKN